LNKWVTVVARADREASVRKIVLCPIIRNRILNARIATRFIASSKYQPGPRPLTVRLPAVSVVGHSLPVREDSSANISCCGNRHGEIRDRVEAHSAANVESITIKQRKLRKIAKKAEKNAAKTRRPGQKSTGQLSQQDPRFHRNTVPAPLRHLVALRHRVLIMRTIDFWQMLHNEVMRTLAIKRQAHRRESRRLLARTRFVNTLSAFPAMTWSLFPAKAVAVAAT
jgi:hypothetical protein